MLKREKAIRQSPLSYSRTHHKAPTTSQSLRLGFRRAVGRRRCVWPWMVNVKLKPSLRLCHSASLFPWLRAVPSSWLCGSSRCCGRWVNRRCLSDGEAADLAANR
ncbi:hypothetical protein FCV25MIE_09769 [Fagus crenata]